jgi:filamentous hemagglutinin
MLAEGRVRAGTLDNTAGVIASNGAAVLRTGSLDNHTGHAVLDTLAVSGPTFDNTGGVLTVLQGIDVHAGRFVNDQGKLQVAAAFTATLGTFSNRLGLLQAAQIDIHATDLLDNSAGTIQATHDLALQSSGTILNAAGSVGTLSDTSTLSMTGAAIDNGDGRIVNAGSGATVVRADVIASHGLIGGNGDVHIAGHAVRNDASGTVTAQGDLNLAADVLFANAGRVDAGGRLQVLQDGVQLNNSGTLAAHGPIDIHVASVDNGAGTIATAAGTGSPVALAAGGLGNRAGTIVADGQAVLTIRGRVDNEHGHIRAGAGLSLDAAERIENRGGDIESAGSLLLHAMDIGNDAGRIVAVGPQAALIDAGRAIDSNGSIGANGRLTLLAQTLANGPAGTVSARGDLDLIVSTAVDNAGTIGTPGALRLDQANATLVNHGSMTAGANVYLNVGRVDNRGGRVIAGQDAAVLVGNAFDNGGGAVQAAGSLAVTAGGALRNQEGTIEALGEHGTLTVHAGAIDNAAGRINGIGDGMATVDATGHIANSGLIAGNGRLTVSGVSLDNAGTISAGAQAELAVTRQVDNSGTISAATGLTMHQAILDVRNSGTIVAGGSIDAAVATIDNANGRIVAVQGSGGDVLIDARSIGNHDGLIAADHDAIVTVAENVDGQGGLLQAGAQLQLDAGGHVDVSAGGIDTLSGGGTLQVHARALRNEAGHIVNAGHGATRVQVDEDLLNSGRMASNGELVVEARTLTNASGGAIVAAGDVAVRAGVIDNDGGRLATAHGSGASIVLDALGVSNRGGSIQADHDLQVRSADAVDNTGGLLQAAGSLVASARGAMVNDGGVIETLGTDATLSLHAGKLDNGSGRLTNVGNGATALTVDASLVSRGTVAGNGSVALHVGDLQNGADGSIVAGGTLRIDVARDIGNHGTISSRHAATVDATHGQVTNHGTIVSGGGATLAAARIDNDAGQIATTTGSAGDIALRANDVSNVGGNVLADGALTIAASGALDNHQGTVRAARAIHIDAGGALGNQDGAIEVATADSALHVSAESIDNERGRLVNAGAGATEIAAKGDILNGGALGGNGTVEVRAGTVHNHAGGSIASGAALEMRIDDRLDNAGKIDAGTTLHIGQATAQIVNAGEIAAAGDLALHGAAIANDGGRIVTRSGADVVLRSESTLGNRAGVIGSQGSVTVQSRAGFDNTHGQVQTSGALSVNVDGVVTNAGGLLESVDAGSTLTLRADAVDNAAGRIVNTGAGEMRIESATDIVNGGTIGGNGALSLSAQDVKNASDGVISAGTALALSMGRQLENAGSIGSGAGMRVDVASGTLKNMGNLSAGASVDIAAGAFGNQGGHVMTRDGSGAAISVAASSLDNTNGTVAADGMLQAALTGAVFNDGGTLHGGSGVSLDAGAALVNAGGTIEAASRTLALRAASIDSSGRIVNAGTGATTIQATGAVVNSGAVAANGALVLAAQTWRNTDAAAVGSGADLELAVRERLDNAGTISSGGTLRFEQVTAALDNSGRIGAHGSIDIVASSVTNRGGQLYTATDSVAAVTLQTQSLDNANGTISADGLLHVQTAGGVANTGGQLHGGTGTLLAAGEDLRNGTGIIETGTGRLEIGARSIGSAGRIVNAGTGQTAIFSATGVLNSGTIAGNGELALSAQTLQNLKSGTIGAGGAMDLAVNHQLDNAGRVGSGTSLHVRQPDGSFSNDGTVEAGGPIEITARAIDNQAGQIDTVAGSGATVKIDTGSLQNASGTISADGTLGIDVANAIANDGGTLHGGTGAALRAGGLLANGSGVIESAAGTLDIRAQSIASSGRIVDAGTGPMRVESGTDLVNAGTIAANGGLALSGGSLVNTASISAAGPLDVNAATVSNAGGRLYTASGSGTGIRMNATSIDNTGGAVSADGVLAVVASAGIENGAGTMHGSAGVNVHAGGTLVSGSGTIESAAGALAIQAGTIASSGRIVNAGTGTTSILGTDAFVNAGSLAGNGELEIAVASLQNTGRIGAGADIDMTAFAFTNRGGQIYTVNGSGGAIRVQAHSLDNAGGTISADSVLHADVAGGIGNDEGKLHGGAGAHLSTGGALLNGSGTIEAGQGALDLQAASIESGGRIVNAGTEATTIGSATGIVNHGTIAGNGALTLSAQVMDNKGDGAIGSGGHLDLAVRQRLDNAGAINSGGAIRFDQAAAVFDNSGTIGASGDIAVIAATVNNAGGRVFTASGSGGAVDLHAGRLDSSGGVLSADGLLHVDLADNIVNETGVLHGGSGLTLHAGGTVANGSGTIEAGAGTLDIAGHGVDSGGRIVNAGTGLTSIDSTTAIVNRGAIAGNGAVAITARTLHSSGGSAVTSAGAMELAVREQLANAGTIGSGGSLHIDQANAEILNTGRIGAAGAIDVSAATFANLGGQLYTSADSGAGIQLHTGSLDNTGGMVSADGSLGVQVGGSATNGGVLHAGAGTVLNVDGALHNGTGTIETTAGTLDVRAASIDSGGRIVNGGAGAVRIDSATGIVNSGTIAAHGELALAAVTLQNDTGGTIGTGSGATLGLGVRERVTNAGTISSGAGLHVDQAAASLVNTGNIGAAGTLDIAMKTIDNTGGRLYTASGSDGAITLHTDTLRNVGGTVATDSLLTVAVTGDVVNDAGSLHGGTGMVLDAGGTLANGAGTIEARSGMLDVRAQSIGSNGRIVNAGTGVTTIASQDVLVNRGIIGGNGRLDLHAAALQNDSGQIASGGDVFLDVRRALVNTGTISSGGQLTFDHADASFANSGQITAGGAIYLTAGAVGNDGGRISTVRGSGGDIVMSAASLSNRNGSILADGNAILSSAGGVDNDRGVLQAGGGLALTAGGNIGNDGGAIEALGNWSTLRVAGATIDNGSGRISNAGSGDTLLQAYAGIDNRGAIAGMGSVGLFGQTLSNATGATLASGNSLTLGVSQRFNNYGKVNSAGSLTFEQAGATFTNGGEVLAGGNAVIHAGTVNNDGGRLGTGTGSGASLALASLQLSNQGGRIATDGDLQVNTHLVGGLGELFGGRDLALSMEGNFVQDGIQQVHSNRNLTLAVTGDIYNASTFATAGTLTLTGQNISNVAGAAIEGRNVVLNAQGGLSNAGEIDGQDGLDIRAAAIGNSGGIVGGNVTLATGSLDNGGSSALIGATGTLNLGVSDVLNNVGGATLYSSGNMTIGGQCGCEVGAVNNISSTIEAGGDLTLKTNSLRNVRENVQIVQVKTVDETVDMSMPGWHQYGDNHSSFEKDAANYRPHEVYFVRPADILDDQIYVTPDGNTIHRAVIRTHANDSAFYVASSGLDNAYGERARLTLSEETRVIYYMDAAQIANPDQGGAAGNAIVHADYVTHWNSSIGFSNQYGNCSDDCIRLVTQPNYGDPRTTRIVDDAYAKAPVKEDLENSLVAHHVALEDQLAHGAGPAAQILAGGNMHLTVGSTLQNHFADIKARGALVIDGTAAIDNVGTTLYRTHSFDGTWTTYGGEDVHYQRASLSEAIGSVAGVIQGGQGVSIAGRSFRNIDVSAGTVGNIRDAVNVIGSGVVGAGGAQGHLATTTAEARTAGVQTAAGNGSDGQAGAHVEAGSGNGGTFGDLASATAGTDGAPGTPTGVSAGLSGERITAGASLQRSASTVVSAGAGVSGHAGVHAVAEGTTESVGVGHLSRSVIDTDSGLDTAFAPTGGGGHPATVLLAAASGHANDAKAAGGAIEGGTAHDVGVSAAAHRSGIVSDRLPGGTVAATPNAIRPGDARMTGNVSTGQQTNGGADGASGNVVKVNPGGLFLRNPDSSGSYLFETRPQFANQRQWISSDYLLKQLAFDPATTQKRLGDGFYEQRLVREQLAELTGHALYGDASDDSTYKELLTNAASVAREFGLRPGIALSAEQVSRLTSDIAWLEAQTVMLPDGHTETVLVPKVYLAHIGAHALQPNGALVAGNDVAITSTDSIVNRGGMIDGGNGRTVLVAARDIVNQGGAIKGDAVALAAGRDVRNESLAVTQTYDFGKNSGSYTLLSNESTIAARGTLDILAGRDLSDVAGKISAASANLTAGRDIGFDTIKTGSTYRSQIDGYTEKDSAVTHQLSQIATAGDLRMAASGDLKLNGTQVAIGTAGQGSGQLLAGGAVTIASVTNEVDTSVRNDPHSKQYDKQVHENQSVVGADVSASGSLTVGAGLRQTGALAVTGSSLTAGDALKLTASDGVAIVAAEERHLSDTAMSRSSHSLLKSKATQQADYVASTDAVGSALSGKSVEVTAGKDINVFGSGIAGDADVRLSANGSVNIGAATRTVTEQHHSQVKESGFLSGDGFGFGIGTRTTTTDQSRDATTQSGQSRSVVGAVHGNLDIVAGDAIKIGGSDLTAGSNMSVDGRSVVINAGQDDSKNAFKQTTVQNGLSFAVGGSAVNAIQTTQHMGSAAAQTKDARFKALAAATAVMTANDAVDDLAKNGPSVRISVTAGHSESESTQVTTASTHTGSALTAGGNVTISATGGGKASNLDIIGSDVHGSGSVALIADNHINLLAAQDTDSQHSKSRSTSAALGVAANIGATGVNVGVTASASASRGNVDGDGNTQIDSHVIAGDQLTIASGADTNLRGAVVSGHQVVADIKGNLNIESLQDTAKLDGKRQSASASGTLGAGAGAGFSASASVSQVHNDFASVAEQSGIRAYEGGFQLQVAGRTDLKGGVISSSEAAIKDGRNSLATGSLSYQDIQNRDKTEASGISLGGNVAANQNGGTFSPGLAPGIGHVSGEQSSVTRSGVSGGELKVADRPGDVVGLNREVTTNKDTAQALVKSWNGAKALDEVGAQMEITSSAMPRLAKEIGDYAENKVAELKNQGNAEEAAKWEEGGAYRVAAHAALGAMGGGVGGALGAAAAAEAAPTLGRLQSALQEKLTDAGLGNDAADAAAKLLVGGAAGTIGGAVGGGAGAAAGLNADLNNRQLHPTEVQVIKNKARDFAKSFYETDSPTAQQIAVAQAYLVYAALADVDRAQAYANTLIGLQKDDQYIAAKRFLTTQKDTFINDAGQVQQVFTTKGNDFYEPLRYSNNNGNQAYRDFFWESVGINLPLLSNSSPSDKQTYNEREIQRFKQDLKNFAPGLVTGAIVAGAGAIALKANGVLPAKVVQGEISASPIKSRSAYEREIIVGNESVSQNVSTVLEVHANQLIASEKQSFAKFAENSASRAYRGPDSTINEKGLVEKSAPPNPPSVYSIDGIITGMDGTEAITAYGTTVPQEIGSLRALARNNGGVIPGPGERGLTRVEYDKLMSLYRNEGPRLQNALDTTISNQSYVYRATTMNAVDIYRKNGFVGGRSGGTYMSTEYVGTDSATLMDRGQVFQHWGEPEVLLRIPTSELSSAVVPRPLGGRLTVGWEPRTLFYPKAGTGGQNQFLGITKTWDDSWVIPLQPMKGP